MKNWLRSNIGEKKDIGSNDLQRRFYYIQGTGTIVGFFPLFRNALGMMDNSDL